MSKKTDVKKYTLMNRRVVLNGKSTNAWVLLNTSQEKVFVSKNIKDVLKKERKYA